MTARGLASVFEPIWCFPSLAATLPLPESRMNFGQNPGKMNFGQDPGKMNFGTDSPHALLVKAMHEMGAINDDEERDFKSDLERITTNVLPPFFNQRHAWIDVNDRLYAKINEAMRAGNSSIEAVNIKDFLDLTIKAFYKDEFQLIHSYTPQEFLEMANRYSEFCKVSHKTWDATSIEALTDKCAFIEAAWILAYEWCTKLDINSAVQLLERGLENFPNSAKLRFELFKYHFSDLADDPDSEDKARSVYQTAVETLANFELCTYLVQVNELLLQTDMEDRLDMEFRDTALKDLLERCSTRPAAYTIGPKRDMLPFQGPHESTSDQVLARVKSTIDQYYKKGLESVKGPEMENLFTFYIDFITKDLAKVLDAKDRREFWTEAIAEAVKREKLSETQCKEYLMEEIKEKGTNVEDLAHLGRVFAYATKMFPKNSWFWPKYMAFACRSKDENLMDKIFLEANEKLVDVPLSDVYIYWREYYSNIKLRWNAEKMRERYFRIGLNGRLDLAKKIQLLYVDYVFGLGDFNALKGLAEDSFIPNPCSEFYMKLAEVETCKEEPPINHVRNLYKKAKVSYHGKADLFIEWIKFEHEFGQPNFSMEVYSEGKTQLENFPEEVERLNREFYAIYPQGIVRSGLAITY